MPPAAEVAPGYPKGLCDAVDRALALDPAQRPRSMAAWAALLAPVRAPEPQDRDAMIDDQPPTIRVRRRPRPQSGAGMPVDPPKSDAPAGRRSVHGDGT